MAEALPTESARDAAAQRAGGPTASKGSCASPWLPWLAWGWVALILLAAVAELTGWADLRLALDVQRHFR